MLKTSLRIKPDCHFAFFGPKFSGRCIVGNSHHAAISERNKQLVVYDPDCHNYSETNPPLWVEIEPGHFVRGSQSEIDAYRKVLG